MGNMTLRNIPEDIHDGLRTRATMNKRSAEAELRAILKEAIVSASKGGFASRLRNEFADVLGHELEVTREKTAAEPMTFE